MPTTIAKQTVVLRTITLDGRSVTVTEFQTDQDIPGVGKTHFSVDVARSATEPAKSYGFASLDDAKRFLSGFEDDDYDGFDQGGQPVKSTRHGLGIPAALFAEPTKKHAEPADATSEPTPKPADKKSEPSRSAIIR